MSATAAPEILSYDPTYLPCLFGWNGYNLDPVDKIFRFSGYNDYNHLVTVNSFFSSAPAGLPVDRTDTVRTPLKIYFSRPWKIPEKNYTLEQALETRVRHIISRGEFINLLWSGGVDSTTIVNAFLQYGVDRSRFRILYSPFSQYEHPDFLEYLMSIKDLEMIDMSGTVYLDRTFDGIFVTGDGGDEIMASLDESFYDNVGRGGLERPWRDFFRENGADDLLIDFCDGWFSISGRSILTVLDARWWFYSMCKTSWVWSTKFQFFAGYTEFTHDKLISFFDCDEFESWIYHDLGQIIPGNQYQDWKLPLKKFCFQNDGLQQWFASKKKITSRQRNLYAKKFSLLADQRYVFWLTDGRRLTTPNLPLLSRLEYEKYLAKDFNTLVNDPC